VIVKRLLVLLIASLGVACDNTVSGPSGTDTSGTTATATPISESFEATLSHGESAFYSFNVVTAGVTTVTLASVVDPRKAAPLAMPMRIALGMPVGEGCEIGDAVETLPALTPQLTATLAPGIHCVWVGDSGQLTGTVIVSIRFVHR